MADFDTLTHEQQLPLLLELAVSATSLYDLPSDLQITLINLSENATYKLQAPDGRRWALRIHRDGYHSRAAIASELAWLMALRQGGDTSRQTGMTCVQRSAKRQPSGIDASEGTCPGIVVSAMPRRETSGKAANSACV